MKDVRLVIRSFKYFLFVKDDINLTAALVKALSHDFSEAVVFHYIVIDGEAGFLVDLVQSQNYIWGYTASDKLRLLRKAILKHYDEVRFVKN